MTSGLNLFDVGWLLLLLGAVIHFALTLATLLGFGPYGKALAQRLGTTRPADLRALSRHIAMHVLIMGVAWWGIVYWGVRHGYWWAWWTLLLMGLTHFAAFAWTETRRAGRWHPPDWRWWALLAVFAVSLFLTAPR